MNDWISAKERKPAHDTLVLVFCRNGHQAYRVAWYSANTWCGVEFGQTVTHWMPLPEPPDRG